MLGVIQHGQPWSEKLLRIASAWMDLQWNEPSRSDYYLMRVAQRVHQQWNSKTTVEISDQEIEFTTKKVCQKTPEEEHQERVERSKSTWMSGLRRFASMRKKNSGN